MEMCLALAVGLMLGGGVRRDRLPFYLTISLLSLTALVLSNSRGGILGLTCQSIFLLFMSLNWYSARRSSRRDTSQNKLLTFLGTSKLVRMVFIALMIGALMAGVLWMGGETLGLKLAARAEASNQVGSDETSRKEIWRWSWEIIKHQPLTGVGFGCYFLAVPQYQTGPGLVKLEQAHNDYLDLAANGGLIAVGLAGWFMAMIIWRARSPFRSADAYRRAAWLGAVGGMLSVAVHSFVDFGLQVTGIAAVFGALVVIAVSDGRVESLSRMRKRRRKTSSQE
jgi:O-antigen ligase